MSKKPTEGANSNGDVASQSIEELQRRYSLLHRKQIEANANLQNAEKQLHSLQAEAREKYGTDDLAQLREKLSAMIAENESQRRDYQAKLDTIERDLADAEAKFATAQSATAAETT